MRLTGRGWGLLFFGALLVFAGFRFGYPALAGLGAAAVVACLGALAFVAWRPVLGVGRVADPDRVQRGEPSLVRLSVTNASRFFGASLVARDRVGAGASVPVPLVRLKSGRATTVEYQVPTARRGIVDIGPLEVTRRDPFGLVGVVRRYGSPVRVWVRPRAHAITAIPVGLSRSLDGRVDRVPHGSITFAALREYVVGDDLRQIHWRTSARVGELMVREHVDTSLPRIVVLLDDRASAHRPGPDGESTFEAACEAAASLALAGVAADVHVELRLVTAGVAVAGDTAAQVGLLLDQLAEATLRPGAGAGPEGPLWRAVELLRARRSGDTLVFLSGPVPAEELGLVAGLDGSYPSIISAVFGEMETGFATTAGMLVVCASDGADFAAAWDGVRAW